jgi:glutamine amidotransferase
MRIGIIKYPGSNSQSVANACQRLGVISLTSSDPKALKECSHLIFPGQGEAQTAMSFLKEREIDTLITSWQRPFLGICLGFQCLFQFSEEGNTSLLQILPGVVTKLSSNKPLPHTGWSKVAHTFTAEICNGIKSDSYYYFLHSYSVKTSEYEFSTAEYSGESFCAGVRRDNFYGVQFHPEKSGEAGRRFLNNFISESRV